MARNLIIVLLLASSLTPSLEAQPGSCHKIRVGVKIEEVYPEVFDFLSEQTGSEKHRAVWLSELGEILMSCLRENSPDIEFIYLSGSPNADYDYLFKSLIALSGGGDDVVVKPGETIIVGDDIFEVPPLYGSEYTVYKVWSSLIMNSNCFPSRRYILAIESGESEDIRRAILSSISGFGRGINFMLYERENQRPVPPRDPSVVTSHTLDYLSPLDEDTRKMKIYENVLSCQGVPAYYLAYHSQPVRFPSKTDRGKIEPVEGCKLEYSDSEIQYILVNQNGDAVGEYTLQKGITPLKETLTLSTCPLGNKPDIEREVEVIIRGLELKVDPERSQVAAGEEVIIRVDLHETDPDGGTYPASGREIELNIEGLADGSVSPSDKVSTDDNGEAKLIYRAGREDRKIKVTGTFTPTGYPEKVKGEAEIEVREPHWEGLISMTESMQAGEKESLLAALTPGGEYDISKNWKVKVTFKPVESATGFLSYTVEKAVLLSFNETTEQTMFRMEREGRVIEGQSSQKAEDKGRTLSSSECDLRLIIDTKSGKYWLKGEIEVDDIDITGKDEMDIKVKPVNQDIDEDADGTTGIDEHLDVAGAFKPAADGSLPAELNGKKDFMQEVPEEFREFMEDLGGNQKIILRWSIRRN